jgi:lipopolysaccharide transport system ATP-binding protein
MSDTVIKIEQVSKQYRLGEIGTGTISHDLNRWWAKLRGKDDPYLKIGSVNDRTRKNDDPYVWALRDISAEIKKGEVWGIIGKNGAGKSTLLKILSRVTTPSSGKISIKGKMAALLEVGTGFHGELTGRENIFLNGAILGMGRRETARKLDEILAFAGVEKYADTPVKRYSSGMFVRLAFAVAAHLDTDILILDEVLAVGDASFQRKCLGKMNDVSAQEGKTVLFVSHNLSQVQGLCKKGMLLEHGQLKYTGDIASAISQYVFSSKQANTIDLRGLPRGGTKSPDFTLQAIEFEKDEFKEGEEMSFILTFECMTALQELVLGFVIRDSLDNNLIECRSTASLESIQIDSPGLYQIRGTTRLNLLHGVYIIGLGARNIHGNLEYIPSVSSIEILPKTEGIEEWNKPSAGIFLASSKWEMIN